MILIVIGDDRVGLYYGLYPRRYSACECDINIIILWYLMLMIFIRWYWYNNMIFTLGLWFDTNTEIVVMKIACIGLLLQSMSHVDCVVMSNEYIIYY